MKADLAIYTHELGVPGQYESVALKLSHKMDFNRCAVTPKSVPPKIGQAGLILAGKSAKTGPPDHFCCQTWSGRTDFGCQKWSPLAKIRQSPIGDRFWQKIICQNRSPSKWHSYSCAHMATWMQLLYHLAMHCYLASLYPII